MFLIENRGQRGQTPIYLTSATAAFQSFDILENLLGSLESSFNAAFPAAFTFRTAVVASRIIGVGFGIQRDGLIAINLNCQGNIFQTILELPAVGFNPTTYQIRIGIIAR